MMFAYHGEVFAGVDHIGQWHILWDKTDEFSKKPDTVDNQFIKSIIDLLIGAKNQLSTEFELKEFYDFYEMVIDSVPNYPYPYSRVSDYKKTKSTQSYNNVSIIDLKTSIDGICACINYHGNDIVVLKSDKSWEIDWNIIENNIKNFNIKIKTLCNLLLLNRKKFITETKTITILKGL